ncbi:hypothetical protein GALMADRAFT_1035660 [Galerina marginata CBS 339.88]|uniref:Uncharacterized protein n=1 Tax=Galerina marginata (strain CBS 339.88) TaxID=685588 RepID=A0A067SCA4_GALM3|nr:hypothetical protein GALMADRAFT_1035660 [Galerina marginata CBS 339.88]
MYLLDALILFKSLFMIPNSTRRHRYSRVNQDESHAYNVSKLEDMSYMINDAASCIDHFFQVPIRQKSTEESFSERRCLGISPASFLRCSVLYNDILRRIFWFNADMNAEPGQLPINDHSFQHSVHDCYSLLFASLSPMASDYPRRHLPYQKDRLANR